jgi:hypothetical protein
VSEVGPRRQRFLDHVPIPLMALAAVAALLASYLLLCERGTPSSGRRAAETRRLLPGFDRATVERLSIRGPAGSFVLERDPGQGGDRAQRHWLIGDGAAAGAHHFARRSKVDELLAALDAAEIDRLGPPEAGVAPSGEAVTMEINERPSAPDAAPSRRAITVGTLDASGRGAFVRREGDGDLLVVGRYLRDLATQPAARFEDRRLMPADGADLDKAARLDRIVSARTGRTGDGDRSIALREGLWRNHKGQRIQPEAVEALVRMLLSMEIDAFSSAPGPPPVAQEKGAADRDFLLEVGPAEAPLLRLSVAHAPGGDAGCPRSTSPSTEARPARREYGGLVEGVCLESGSFKSLVDLIERAAIRDPALIQARAADVTRVDLERAGGGAGVALVRQQVGGGWALEKPPAPWPVDRAEVDAWLERLTGYETNEIRARGEGGVEPRPIVTLALTRNDGSREIVRLLADPYALAGAGRVLVGREGEPRPASATAALAGELEVDPLRFRERRPLALARYDVERIRILGPDAHGQPLDLVKGPGEIWSLTPGAAHGAAALDSAALDGLLAAATDLVAVRYLPPETVVVPRRSLDMIERRGQDTATHHLEVGSSGPSGCTARLASGGGSAVFKLAAGACAPLLAPITAALRR